MIKPILVSNSYLPVLSVYYVTNELLSILLECILDDEVDFFMCRNNLNYWIYVVILLMQLAKTTKLLHSRCFKFSSVWISSQNLVLFAAALARDGFQTCFKK